MKIKVSLPPRYLVSSVVTSLGGLLNGLDTGVIGPVTVMSSFTATFGEISFSLQGLIVSCVLLSATFASLFSGTLSDTLGRTRALAAGALVFGVGAVIEAIGAGEGLFLSTLVVYICEISPAETRGPLASMVKLFITIGLMVGFFMCYGTVKSSTSFSWRFPLALQAGISFALALSALYYLPESPKWLNHRGHLGEAERAWNKLEVAGADRGPDTFQESVQHEQQLDTNFITRFRSYYHDAVLNTRRVMGPASQKQAFLAVFLMSMQQLSGIDVLSIIMAIIGSLYASGSVHQTSGPGRWVQPERQSRALLKVQIV
ncbi:hexose carrier protein, putative [Talaromyces stipitatus ATCC 10500]|uniref:Hexose carrier protein, putative n=1 Tax=Talaromyces stipitatus (strain ATCC 10500 / CBS 375.48 / QM 6759 / NRRL 1006) TaxID=441959 RepID=B8M6U3_TALSN|nr:hexose carrier protein, putative [Talaromyces stipitatus ATCC 10500]EED20163.1 hexose carrier protein, putative [Talaromyces stipitatus ATCC 10500]